MVKEWYGCMSTRSMTGKRQFEMGLRPETELLKSGSLVGVRMLIGLLLGIRNDNRGASVGFRSHRRIRGPILQCSRFAGTPVVQLNFSHHR